jgi:outer membrane autotransporter protein
MGDASSLPPSAAEPVWAQVFGHWRTLGGDNGNSKVRESDGGLFVGTDRAVGDDWRLGGAIGYTGSHSSAADLASKADIDSYSATIGGGKAFTAGPGQLNLTLGAAYTWHDIRTQRTIGVGGLHQVLMASYGASTSQFFAELGYALPLNDRVTLEPFVGLDDSDLRTRGFSESGGDAALDGASGRNHLATTTLGLHVETTFDSDGVQGGLHGSVGWRHAYGDVDPETTLAFNGSQPFTVGGAPIARISAVLELGMDIAVTKHTTVGMSYNGQFGSGNQLNAGMLNVRHQF